MILVTGATGNVGRELVRTLDAAGERIRILVRDPTRAAGLCDKTSVAVADLTQPTGLKAAFDGVDRLFLLTQGTGIDQAANAVAAAVAAGVRRIVLLSSVNVIGDPVPAMGRWHHARERLVLDSGIPATILRPSGFMTNALEWAPTIREGNYVLDPTGPGRFSLIDPADIADVAARALLEDGHEGEIYALTGDEVRTTAEHVRILADVLGRTIEVRTAATAEDAVRARYANGAPPALAAALLEAITAMRADTDGFRTDDVRQVLRRSPRTFEPWCVRHAEAFDR
ncbi:NAD(P)H-binding protein [Actinospica robiniae]|uniref:Putative nucleoside-diphosphate sugar epimerase n=1 Tax=Actinospica robiniae DSM 44927 TaxID=479430 RepID=W9E4Y3_9ACTN|nr:NAD(P)H-binding protein [Actinospica robiniae]ETA71031.1 putative nucleoside-diphosphate sugar epimerase [Actinospica robiniae DSM 44927]